MFGRDCHPFLVDLFLYSYETDFIHSIRQRKEKKLAQYFGFTFRYMDDVFSLNNSQFGDYVDRIYPIKLGIKDTIETEMPASYLDLHLEIDRKDGLRTNFTT